MAAVEPIRPMAWVASPMPFRPSPAHRAAVRQLVADFHSIPPSATVRLAKRTSNLFRSRTPATTAGLDVTGLAGVLHIDPVARTADVGGMCTYETLLDATLRHHLSPTVVPQLKTITVGGAVTGLGIESASFRNGLVHESVLELDILTGQGEVLTATPDGEHADLFAGFPNSYGSLGYATRVRLRLEPVETFVELRHLRYHHLTDLQDDIARICESGSYQGRAVDYLDGVVFSAGESYLTLGRRSAVTGPVSDYTGRQIYYRSLQHRTADRLTTRDYLWRWDTDWFWCSRAFGAQHRLVRRLWPKALRRSSFYWKLVALDRRFSLADRIERLHRRPPLERVVQDVEIPVERTAEFLRWFLATVPIEPLWLCPLRMQPSADSGPAGTGEDRRGWDGTWPLYPLQPDRTYVNVGFWSAVPGPAVPGPAVRGKRGAQTAAGADHPVNQRIEEQVTAFGGHKSLYSDAFYSPATFAELYGGAEYDKLKARYDPDGRLSGMYEKTVGRG